MPVSRTIPAPHGRVPLAVHDFGGHGPDLLLAHATGLHGMVWAPVADELGGHFRCVSFDERGHGDSGRPADGDFRWRGFADDALLVADTLGLERPFGVGHSCGGAALLLAEEGRQGTFSALWCYEPVVFPGGPAGPDEPNHLAAGARRRRERFPGRIQAYENFAAKPPFDRVDPVALRAYVDHGFADEPDGSVRLKCRPGDEAATFDNSRTHDAFEHLDRVACPVTLVTGELTDAPFGRGTMEAMATRLPRARVETAPGLGHFGPLEDPVAVARSITEAFRPG